MTFSGSAGHAGSARRCPRNERTQAIFAILRSLIFCVALAAGSLAASAEPQPVDCTAFGLGAEIAGVTCWNVSAPLRHEEPDGPAISLAVAVLAPLDPGGAADPLFMAQGGPGGGTIGTFAEYLLDHPEDRPTANREIVLWDQRGTGFSTPVLDCPEFRQAVVATAAALPDEQEVAAKSALEACGARLAAEIGDLSAFNSVENARDVETVRQALGYERINFYGVSYGSELAQFVMREMPGHLRSVVLDAVVPIDYDLMTEPARAQQMIGEKYLLGCGKDARCDAAFPDLARRYLAMIDRLNAAPVSLTVHPLDAGESGVDVSLTGDLLEDALYSMLYGNVTQIVPLIVDRADKGDYSLIASVLLPTFLFEDGIAQGMHIAVVCAERSKTSDPANFDGLLPRVAERTRRDAETQSEICDNWNIAELPADQLGPVSSQIPVLMLSGAYDPITPPVYAERLLPRMPAAFHVVFPGGTHGQVVTNGCANRLTSAFLDDPLKAPDSTCVPASVPEALTEDDVIFLAVLNHSLSTQGLRGLVMAGVAQLPALLAGLLLLVAPLLYAMSWILRRLLSRPRRTAPLGYGWALVAPPWISLATGLLVLATIAALSLAVTATLAADQYLATMGAIPRSFGAILALPWMIAALAVTMLAVAALLWQHRLRSVLGRLGFSVLTVIAVGAAVNLILLTR